jgi:hypothetical protein
MTIEPSDFLNGHGQNDHFGDDHQMVMVIWSRLTDTSPISTINNFNNKKSGIVDMAVIEFGLTILIRKVL